MKNLKSARKEMNGLLAFFVACKALLVLTNRFLGTGLYWVLTQVFGDGAPRAYLEFASYGTLSGLLLEISVFIFCLFVPICLYFFFSGKKYTKTIPSEKPEFLQICFGVGATVLIGNISASVGNAVLSILFSIFGMEDKYYAMLQSDISYPSNFWLIPLFVLMLAVLPAFFEEISMRGIGISVTKKFGILFTLFFSGFFFAFMHNSWTQLPYAFVIGIVLAYFTLRFKTIWIAVLSHFFFNFNSVIQCLILQNAERYGDILSIIWGLLFTSLMAGLMIAGIIVYGVKRPDVPKSEYSAAEKIKILFSSPFLYVFLLLEAYQLIYLLMIY